MVFDGGGEGLENNGANTAEVDVDGAGLCRVNVSYECYGVIL